MKKRYFEHHDDRSAKFWEISRTNTVVQVRYGKIGTTGRQSTTTYKSAEAAKAAYDRRIKEKLAKNYQEIAPTSTETPEPSRHTMSKPKSLYLEHADSNTFFAVESTAECLTIQRGHIGRPCLSYHLSFTDADECQQQYKRLIKDWKKRGYRSAVATTAIIPGSSAREGFTRAIAADSSKYADLFGYGWITEQWPEEDYRVFIFPDGLRYDDDFDVEDIADMDLAVAVIVDGDVHVDGVFSQRTYTYPSVILITGNLYAHSLVHADSMMTINGNVRVENIVYGHYNDGSLGIGGDVYGAVWVSYDHDMWAAGTYHLPICGWDIDDANILSPKVLDWHGSLDPEALQDYIWQRKNPLRRGYVFVPPAPTESTTDNEAEAAAEDNVTLSLEHQISELAMADDADGMVDLLESWPEHDSEWALMIESRLSAPSCTTEHRERLTALQASGPPLTPAAIIDKLQTLQPADLESSDVLEWLDSIDELPLVMEQISPIPESLSWLRKLTKLSLIMIEPEGQALPTSLGELTHLQELALAWSGFTELPKSIEQLSQLRLLSLMCNQLTTLPPLPTGIETLILDDNPLALAPDLSSLTKLKSLSVSDMDMLPTGLQNLPALETVKLSQARLQRPEQINIIQALEQRGVTIIDESQEEVPDKSAPPPAKKYRRTKRSRDDLKQASQHNKKAQKLAQQKRYLQALECYEQALALCNNWRRKFTDDFSYDYLFALQGKLWCYNELVDQDHPEYRVNVMSLSQEVIDRADEMDTFYYSDDGALSRNATLLAHNTLAKYNLLEAMEKIATDRAGATELLELALNHSNTASEDFDYHAEPETIGTVLANRVDILLALERNDAAYALVYQVLQQHPSLSFFTQLAQTAEYRQWDASN